MKRIIILLFLCCCRIAVNAQTITDSCSMEISLITCAPGSDLYSIFGHTAIRVRDEKREMDIVYNYGTFDDTDPLFYFQFTRGIMNYSLSAETMDTFLMEYQYEHRKVKSQILHLSCGEKYKLYAGLRKNTLEENRIYQYHFHTDNCTTRAGKIIAAFTDEPVIYHNILPKPPPSFRDMIHEYLDPQHMQWSKFGIDLLLGKNLDVIVSNEEAIHFLPDYLYLGTDSAFSGNRNLVLAKETLLDFPDEKVSAGFLTPMKVFITFFLLFVILQFLLPKTKMLLVFDIIFFSLLGLFGFLIACLWLGRVDTVCRDNINILWALPTHLFAVFFIRKKAGWIKIYFLITAVLATILVLGFPWWTQRINPAALPLLGIIILRSFQLFQNRNHAEKHFVLGPVAGI